MLRDHQSNFNTSFSGTVDIILIADKDKVIACPFFTFAHFPFCLPPLLSCLTSKHTSDVGPWFAFVVELAGV